MWSSIFSLNKESNAVQPDPSGAGINIKYWFWGAAKRLAHAADKNQLGKQANKKGIPHDKWSDCSHDVAAKGKVSNAYAVCNWSLGRKYTEKIAKFKAQKQADSLSANPVVALPVTVKAKPKKKKESKIAEVVAQHFREAKGGAGGEYDTSLITEGLGNLKDCFYYSRDAIESGVAIFEGLKSFLDHPTLIEEDTRPERSVRDVYGHFEGCSVGEDDGGCATLDAKLITIPSAQHAIDLIERAIENADKFPDRPFIGLSINATGSAEPTPIDEVIQMAPPGAKPKLEEAKAQGIETVKVVKRFEAAVSCDLVTEAGAGGKILSS